MLARVGRIARAVKVPVTADLEAGYGTRPEDAARTAREAIEAGAVGMNLEDGTDDGAQPLVELPLQLEKIRAVREAALKTGVLLVLNARTDVYLAKVGEPGRRYDETLRRAVAFRDAGADCVFVPDMYVLGESEIAALAKGIEAPLNLIAGAKTPSVRRLEALGVARLSFGPRPMRAALQFLRDMARQWLATGTWARPTSSDSLSYDEVNAWFTPSDAKRTGCEG
jgi:2-methylisocitrate lyase-like PEP mutase family enzyme